MHISYVAINRMVEEQAAQDEDYRQQLVHNRKKTLSTGRALSDDELLEKLRSLGLPFDRGILDELSQQAPSAQSLSDPLLTQASENVAPEDEDWVWIGLTCLWERWFPDRPNFEMLDDQMQAGYQHMKHGRSVEACREWRKAWHGVERLMRDFDIPTIEAFDGYFGGTQSVFNWVQDFSMELYNAAPTDPSFHNERIKLCKAILSLAGKSERDQMFIEGFEDDLAESEEEMADSQRNAGTRETPEKLDAIIAELDREYFGVLPKEAIRAAEGCAAEITPRLIRLIEDATEKVRNDREVKSDGHFIALYLLGEFGAKEALPAIIKAVSLPERRPFDLFGDAVTSDLKRILAATGAEDRGSVASLIDDPSINEYVRCAAADSYLFWVRDGLLSRVEAVRCLDDHLSKAIAQSDNCCVTHFIWALCELAPREALVTIEEAFRQGVVDTFFVDLKSAKSCAENGEARYRRCLEECPPTRIPDTVTELESWPKFSQNKANATTLKASDELNVAPVDDFSDAAPDDEPLGPISRDAPRVGRNSPCPCGSGKKFKKCCGSR